MYHEPVMTKEVLDLLRPESNEHFIDCTLGDAGHTIEILKKTGPAGKILAFDLDKKAINTAKERLKEFGLIKRVEIINDNFRNLKKYQKSNPAPNQDFHN